jgi:hypothetical protein
MSARPGWGVEGLINGFKDSMILENEGRFQGSLQNHLLMKKKKKAFKEIYCTMHIGIKLLSSLGPAGLNYRSYLRIQITWNVEPFSLKANSCHNLKDSTI